MLCENCQKNQAVIHLQTVINGEKKNFILCEECAAKTESQISFDKLFHGFLDSFFNVQGLSFGDNVGASPAKGERCACCGMTFEDFRQVGRLGCSTCYTTFGKPMESILKNIQGSSVHLGKFPKKYGAELQSKRELENLQASLRKAIETEAYEDAAKIRDAIKALSKAGDEHA